MSDSCDSTQDYQNQNGDAVSTEILRSTGF